MSHESKGNILLGVDTGGTFTDLVVYRDGALIAHKVLSTPHEPEQAILTGVRELGLEGVEMTVIHGSTVATNAVLEGKLARTAFVTNRGFGDVLTIGRQARARLYDLQPPAVAPPVPRELCLETGGRMGPHGQVVEALTDGDVEALVAALKDLAPEAVAISLLFSFVDARFEQHLAAALPPEWFVSTSATVLPEYGEYERGIATWLNAAVGPRVAGYVGRLGAGLPRARVAVMQSCGETVSAHQAGQRAVHMLLSGPAGGLAGAGLVGGLAGEPRSLSFDMGGTSTDVALIDGSPRLTTEGRVAGYPVGVPMVDMHTIGAGGGSVAWVDAGGMLQVGPESAGAAPGPACYGAGGTRPTVTDANLVLGRLVPGAFLGGRMGLDRKAARRALTGLGQALGMSAEEAAAGVVRVANEHMARALRVISVERGIDPRDMALVSFGGAGGLHVCALSEALGMERALVPVHAGVLSALGMLAAAPGRRLSRTFSGPALEVAPEAVEQVFGELEAEGRGQLEREGVAAAELVVTRSVDLRYAGQSFALTLPLAGTLAAAAGSFHEAHAARYGHTLERAVELVNLRVAVTGPAPRLRLPRGVTPAGDDTVPRSPAGDRTIPAQVVRDEMEPGQELAGPAIVSEAVATTYVAPGWRCRLDDYRNLVLRREG
ncbi:MAG: hydantoinase/oxoprolinase family protein [Gammaproteobacteria bacterium]|nr:hydantoinase/oxoprolinase family protein [Gammaproteobacteria bacterium]